MAKSLHVALGKMKIIMKKLCETSKNFKNQNKNPNGYETR